jgi:hypothetical protein
MCGGLCKGCGGCPEFRAWHAGQAATIAVEVRWPACDAVLEVVQAAPVRIWAAAAEAQYGVAYKGRVYPLHGDKSSGRHFIEIG